MGLEPIFQPWGVGRALPYIDYYLAVDIKDFNVYRVSKQWVKYYINDIANAKIEGSRIVFSF